MTATHRFRGSVQARALVVAAPLIGETEARTRVLELWRPGITVHRLPTGDWLVVLPEPETVRADQAPGLPLQDGPRAGRIDVPQAGEVRTYDTVDLPELDPAEWLDLSGYARHALAPLEPPQPPPTALLPPESSATPDLRATAGVREASPKALRGLRAMTDPVARAGTGARSGGTSGTRPPREGLLTGWVLRSPAAGWLRRRHERYLRRLTRQFERQSWDEALRDAVALGGPPGGRTTLRLPGHRTGPLRPTGVRTPGGGVIPYGASAHEHLRQLYRQAAQALEKEGRVEEAAFVLADLLDDPTEAAALLERHSRTRLAAELAEGRDLDPALVVRLWWRAGERERALRVARARGAFAAAVDRLGPLDREAAVQLRLAWSADRYAAGDLLGAIEAAWPEPELRPGAVSLARQGLDGEAPNRAALLAYALARRPDPVHLDEARTMLAATHPDEADWREHQTFARTLRNAVPDVRSVDRELSTAALRAVLRGAPHEVQPEAQAPLVKALRKRADPLFTADLVPVPRPATRPTLHLRAEQHPGQLPLSDAVALSPAALLTAHCDMGVRLLGRDGRVRARWDVPAHRLVVADHGGTALLVAERGEVRDIHRLDLATRRVRHWTTLRVRETASSYDGSVLAVVDEDGIAFIETRAEQPRVLRRELDRDHTVARLARTPHSLAAVLAVPPAFAGGAATHEVWRWELPGITLRGRSPLPAGSPVREFALLAEGTALRAESGDEGLRLHTYGTRPTNRSPHSLPADTTGLLADGEVLATVVKEGTSRIVWFAEAPGDRKWAGVTFPDGPAPRLRVHAGLATVHDAEGRIVVLDTARRAPVLSTHTSLA
ncbi:MAG: hypothetical protein QOF44_2174 [Streptomyces sp.]|nr:hypothetical protein [Streptomyces sp.]